MIYKCKLFNICTITTTAEEFRPINPCLKDKEVKTLSNSTFLELQFSIYPIIFFLPKDFLFFLLNQCVLRYLISYCSMISELKLWSLLFIQIIANVLPSHFKASQKSKDFLNHRRRWHWNSVGYVSPQNICVLKFFSVINNEVAINFWSA